MGSSFALEYGMSQLTEIEQKQYDNKEIISLDGRHMVCINPESRYNGWVFYKHPDGQWVTERRALPNEIEQAKQRLSQLDSCLDIPQRG